MRVSVKSFASVIDSGRITRRELDLAEGARARDAMAAMGIPPEAEMIVLVNQRPLTPEAVLAEGDAVVLMPPVSAA